MEDIDSIAKNDNCFPTPEQNKVLFKDGLGFNFIHADELLPAALMKTVFEYIGSRKFTSLFGNEIITTGLLFQLPDNYSIRYNSNNRLYQDVYCNDNKLFSVLYGRDYNDLRIYTDMLDNKLESKDLVFPELRTKPDSVKLYRYADDQDWSEYNQVQLPHTLKNDFHCSVIKILKLLC